MNFTAVRLSIRAVWQRDTLLRLHAACLTGREQSDLEDFRTSGPAKDKSGQHNTVSECCCKSCCSRPGEQKTWGNILASECSYARAPR